MTFDEVPKNHEMIFALVGVFLAFVLRYATFYFLNSLHITNTYHVLLAISAIMILSSVIMFRLIITFYGFVIFYLPVRIIIKSNRSNEITGKHITLLGPTIITSAFVVDIFQSLENLYPSGFNNIIFTFVIATVLFAVSMTIMDRRIWRKDYSKDSEEYFI